MQESKLSSFIDIVLKRLKDSEAKIAEHDSTLMLLKSFSGGGSEDTEGARQGMLDALEILVENLRKECYSKFAERDELYQQKKLIDDLNRRLSDLEKRLDSNDSSLNQCRTITNDHT